MRNLRSIRITSGLIAAVAVIALVAFTVRARSAGKIDPVLVESMSSADLDMSIGRQIAKVSVALPAQSYSVNLWVETWRRGSTSPEIQSLATIDYPQNAVFDRLPILFVLPTPTAPDWHLDVGNCGCAGTMKLYSNDAKSGFGTAGISRPDPFGPNFDLPMGLLVAEHKFATSSGMTFEYPSSSNPTLNEITYAFKLRFVPGTGHHAISWNRDKVVFN